MYRLTNGPDSHQHQYHLFSPWRPDGSQFLTLAFRPGEPVAEVRALDLATGEEHGVGRSRAWGEHNGASQRWHDDRGTVIYEAERKGSGEQRRNVYRLVSADAPNSAETIETEAGLFDSRPGFFLGSMASASRIEDRGLVRVDPRTGGTEMLCSVSHALEMMGHDPGGDGMNPFLKMHVMHRCRPWAYFKLTNEAQDGPGNRLSRLFVIDLESRRILYLGPFAHHPAWHPEHLWIVSFSDDEQNRRRIAIDRIQEDGSVEREFTPYVNRTGHPSFDPTGRFIAVDNYDERPGWIVVDVLDRERDYEVHRIAEMRRAAYGENGRPLDRPAEELIAPNDFFNQNYRQQLFRIQAHPAWDRTGRYLAFNSDHDRQSQIYTADLAAYGLVEPSPSA